MNNITNDHVEELIPTPTDGDIAEYGALCDAVRVLGRERMAIEALDSGFGIFPLAMFLAAQGASIEEVVDTLCLDAGDLDEAISWTLSPEGQADASETDTDGGEQ